MHKFLVVIEKAGENYSAYVPDLPGCIATGANRTETERNIYEAIRLHIAGLESDGETIPEATAASEYLVFDA